MRRTFLKMRRKHLHLHRETVSQKGKKIDIFFIIFLLPPERGFNENGSLHTLFFFGTTTLITTKKKK